MTLLTFAAECYAAGCPQRATIDRYFLLAGPTAANLPRTVAAGEWDRQTDRWTPYCFIDRALHTM